jgi:hypothetical protein
MDAGRSQTLLKIRYNDSDRLVEPYALKYQQRRDGLEREYLYVYNVTGGDSRPGIRSFVAEKVQSIENTDQKFVPRDDQQIELSKAGELPENPYLFDPNKPVKQSKMGYSFPRTRNYGIRYIYHCNVCGKSFIKSSSNNKLGKHKSKNGNQCYSRYGIYVGSK